MNREREEGDCVLEWREIKQEDDKKEKIENKDGTKEKLKKKKKKENIKL